MWHDRTLYFCWKIFFFIYFSFQMFGCVCFTFSFLFCATFCLSLLIFRFWPLWMRYSAFCFLRSYIFFPFSVMCVSFFHLVGLKRPYSLLRMPEHWSLVRRCFFSVFFFLLLAPCCFVVDTYYYACLFVYMPRSLEKSMCALGVHLR